MSADDPKDTGAPGIDPAADPLVRGGRTAELEAQRAETEKFRDLYLRERAEFENYKKRIHRDHAEAVRYAASHLTRDLAESSTTSSAPSSTPRAAATGSRWWKACGWCCRERSTCSPGTASPASMPPARRSTPSVTRPWRANTCPTPSPIRSCEQFLPGYALHDRVVRPAKVSVSAKAPVDSPPDDD